MAYRDAKSGQPVSAAAGFWVCCLETAIMLYNRYMALLEKRWVQRFDNYLGVLRHLESFVATTETRSLSVAEEFAVIKAFELVFECAWNVLKDFLQESGHSQIYGSRDAIRLAFRVGLIENGEIWLDMIKKRNNTTHAYDEDTARAVSLVVSGEYMNEFRRFRSTFEELREKGEADVRASW